MRYFRGQTDPMPDGASDRGIGPRDVLGVLALAALAAVIAATIDLAAVLARWSSAGWGWLIGDVWVALIVASVAFAIVAARRQRAFGAEIARRHEAEARLADFAAASSEWFWETDARQRFVMVSDQAPAALAELARTRAPWRPDGAAEDEETWARHRANLASGRPFRDFRFTITEPDGRVRHLQISGRPVRNAAGQLIGYRGTGREVTREAATEANAEQRANLDPLTGLPNREGLVGNLQHALTRARQYATPAALLCVDLDRFNEVNDTLGQAAGDRLIKACAERLAAWIGEADSLARIGGDLFAVVQHHPDQPGAADLLCRRLLGCLTDPFEIDGEALLMTASIGVVQISGEGQTPDDLLRHADIALHCAKAEGGAAYRFFAPEMDTDLRNRKAWETELRRALDRGEFELHFQPQIQAETRTVVGLEALLRWRHPTQGLIMPKEFLPAAEGTGLIVPLGAWVLQEACARAAGWPKIRVSVNLSPVQFAHRDLVEVIQTTLERTGLEPDRLELEIAETALLADTQAACEILDQIKQLGVRVAIDDFGAGYSSLSYLQKFDKIKIARSFTGALDRGEGADAIVHAIMGLGRNLGVAVCAEGVETAAQSSWLCEQRCLELQGFLFSRALELREVEALLEAADDPAKLTVPLPTETAA